MVVGLLACLVIGFIVKINVGTTMINDKVEEMNQKFQVYLKTKFELHVCKRLASGVEMKLTESKHIQWAINLFEIFEEVYGWSMSLGVDDLRYYITLNSMCNLIWEILLQLFKYPAFILEEKNDLKGKVLLQDKTGRGSRKKT